MKSRSLLVALLVVSAVVRAQVPGATQNRVLLPNGWWLSPAGEQIRLGDFPLNGSLSDDERYLAVTHSGQSKAQVMLKERQFAEPQHPASAKRSYRGNEEGGPDAASVCGAKRLRPGFDR